MNISIFGLGYVGCVSLGCLAKNGHNVIGVDINDLKAELINKGKPTIIEKDIDVIIKEEFDKGKISATTCAQEAVLNTSVSIICVGTPSSPQGHLNLNYIYKTAEQIGEALKEKDDFHVVVVRSTVMPGTNKKLGEIIEKFSEKKRNVDFSVVSNPEFLREGSAVKDYYHPAVTVIGGDNDKALGIVASLYQDLPAPIEKTDIEVAEIIKYVNNSFHALKISFANEVGNICKSLNIDSHKVMDIFCKDTHLNISPAYFKPGFAYGGSCLPKDLKGMVTLAHDHYLSTPVLGAVHDSNETQKRLAFELIQRTGKRKIALMGLSFKEGTDDLRYSPSVDMAEKLIGKGFQLTIFDSNVHISKLVGANKLFIEEHLPHLSDLITDDPSKAINEADVILLNHKNFNPDPFLEELSQKESLIDLVRIPKLETMPNYIGLCW
ncbi:UDP-glucose/GDP-mannose dehydrogenase family protein [Echinicola sp. CAU 1574]|uniref:UDP-glucose 6-dehydrogenase n=1 Tax=Echinicola arenosa TaxID=2774144 RepID=A0ABR9ANV7_9BACT|nr:nucleotide sugar dehydrogenase [Echinicola arenosa]MBD8490471.1 UDP-glucose/GDP-mannose dehydrogenase family protein [Echinicola arenosa]